MQLKCLVFLALGLSLNILYNVQSPAHNSAKIYYDKAVEFESQNIDSTLFYVDKAYTQLKAVDTTNVLFTDILNQYGRAYYLKQDFKTAYAYFVRVYDLSLNMGEEANAYKVKVNMAICNRQLDQPKKALEDFFDVVSYYERTAPEDINLGKTYFNIADLYFLNKQHENAEGYYQKSEPFFEAIPMFQFQLITNRIGNFNNFSLNNSAELVKEFENKTLIDSVPKAIRASLFNNMGQTMVMSKNYEKALFYNFESLKSKKETGVKFGLANQYNNIADVYIKTQDYPVAIKYLDTALSLASSNRQKFQIFKNLQLAHKETQNFQKSLDYANRYIALKDSLNEVLTQKELANLGLEYDTQTKDAFISKLTNLSSTYKILILILIVLSLVALGLFYRKNKRIKADVETLQHELDTYKNERANLKPQGERIQLNTNVILNSNAIRYLKSDGHYVEYHLDEKTRPEIDRISLSQAYKNLPDKQFARIHKSYVVNLNFIKIINSTKLMLDDGTWLNLSRTYKPDLKARLYDK